MDKTDSRRSGLLVWLASLPDKRAGITSIDTGRPEYSQWHFPRLAQISQQRFFVFNYF